LSESGGLEHAHDVFFAHQEQFFTLDLDGLPGILAEQDPVPDLEIDWPHLAVFQYLALSDREDFALVGLLGRGIGNDNAGGGLALFFETLDDDSVMQWTDFHEYRSSVLRRTFDVVDRREPLVTRGILGPPFLFQGLVRGLCNAMGCKPPPFS